MNRFRMGTSRGSFAHDLPVSSDLLAHFAVQSKQTTACALDTSYYYDYSSYYDDGSISFSWTFEGGTPATSTDMNPKVTYATPGIYDVTLVLTDGSGNSSTATKTDFISVGQSECEISTIPGKAIHNVDNNNYVKAPSMDITATQHYTMMAWVKGEGTQRDYAGILSHKLSNGSVHLNVRSVSADSTQLGYHHPNGQWWWNSGLYLVPDQWAHVALVVEPTGISIYKNGIGSKHNRTVVAADLIEKFCMSTMIGREGDRCFKGLIDEVAFIIKHSRLLRSGR